MRQQQMTRLIRNLPQLTYHQQMASCVQTLIDRSQTIAVVEARISTSRACLHCCGTVLVKNGSANGLQRFKCRQCAHTFNALTGTLLARLHLWDKWLPLVHRTVSGGGKGLSAACAFAALLVCSIGLAVVPARSRAISTGGHSGPLLPANALPASRRGWCSSPLWPWQETRK